MHTKNGCAFSIDLLKKIDRPRARERHLAGLLEQGTFNPLVPLLLNVLFIGPSAFKLEMW